jgi:hypothetical protein
MFHQNTTTSIAYSDLGDLVTYKMFSSSGTEAHGKWTLPATSANILHTTTTTTESKKIQQNEKSYLEKDQTADVS